MRQKKLLVVSLQTSDPEYNMVASKFLQTCQNFVIEKVLSFLMEKLHSYISDIINIPE